MSSPIRVQSGVSKMLDDLAAFFDAHDVKATVTLGWKERTKQVNQGPGGAARVVFVPSDEEGDGGAIAPTAKYPGDLPVLDAGGNTIGVARISATWQRTLVMSVWAHDATRRDDERAQIEAVEDLFRMAIVGLRAVTMKTGAGQTIPGVVQLVRFSKVVWTTKPTELRNGAELRCWIDVTVPLYEPPREALFPGATLEPDPSKAA